MASAFNRWQHRIFLRNLKNEMFSAENDGVAAKLFVSSFNITTVPQFILLYTLTHKKSVSSSLWN